LTVMMHLPTMNNLQGCRLLRVGWIWVILLSSQQKREKVMQDKKLEAIEHFKAVKTSAQAKLNEFKIGFEKDAVMYLTWADTCFKAALVVEQVDRILYCLTNVEMNISVAQVKQELRHSLYSHSYAMSHSTSQSSNILSFYKPVVLAELIEQLGYFE